MAGAEPSGDVNEAKVGDDGVAVLEEDVLRLQVLVHDAPVVEVAHALGDLLRHDDELVHRELVPPQVEMGVQRIA